MRLRIFTNRLFNVKTMNSFTVARRCHNNQFMHNYGNRLTIQWKARAWMKNAGGLIPQIRVKFWVRKKQTSIRNHRGSDRSQSTDLRVGILGIPVTFDTKKKSGAKPQERNQSFRRLKLPEIADSVSFLDMRKRISKSEKRGKNSTFPGFTFSRRRLALIRRFRANCQKKSELSLGNFLFFFFPFRIEIYFYRIHLVSLVNSRSLVLIPFSSSC